MITLQTDLGDEVYQHIIHTSNVEAHEGIDGLVALAYVTTIALKKAGASNDAIHSIACSGIDDAGDKFIDDGES